MLLSLGEEACCLFQWFPWTQVQLYVPLKPSKVQQWFEVSTKIKLATDQIFVMFFVTTSLSTRAWELVSYSWSENSNILTVCKIWANRFRFTLAVHRQLRLCWHKFSGQPLSKPGESPLEKPFKMTQSLG